MSADDGTIRLADCLPISEAMSACRGNLGGLATADAAVYYNTVCGTAVTAYHADVGIVANVSRIFTEHILDKITGHSGK